MTEPCSSNARPTCSDLTTLIELSHHASGEFTRFLEPGCVGLTLAVVQLRHRSS